jgi:hypothetical protein
MKPFALIALVIAAPSAFAAAPQKLSCRNVGGTKE